MFRHASWVAAMLIAAPARSTAQPTRRLNPPAAAVVSITGTIHGSIPPAACFEQGGDGIAVQTFQETTGRGETGRLGPSGTFEIEMETACVAPFFQALFARERLSTRVTFTGPALRAPYAITLEDAQLTHVDMTLMAAGGRSLPLVVIGLSSPHIVVGDTSGSIVQAGAAERSRARAFRAWSTPAAGITSTDAWIRRGVDAAVHLSATTQPATDETSHIRGFRLSVTASASRSSTASVRILLDSIVPSDASADSERLGSRALLNQAVLLVNGQDGTTGITVWLKGAHVSNASSNGKDGAAGSFSISATTLTITDISSGRTASTP